MEQAQLMVVWAQVQAHLCLILQTADGIKPSVANYFRHGAAHGYPFYNTPTVHINNFWDFARGSNEYDRNFISTEMVHHPQRVIMVTKTLLS